MVIVSQVLNVLETNKQLFPKRQKFVFYNLYKILPFMTTVTRTRTIFPIRVFEHVLQFWDKY